MTRGRKPTDLELPLSLDADSAVARWRQLADAIREAALRGRLEPRQRMPSSRHLARTLGVSRIVVTTAYDQLFAEGILETRQGSGTYVSGIQRPPGAADGSRRRTPPPPGQLRVTAELVQGAPFGLGPAAPDGAGERAWRRALAAAAHRGGLSVPDPRGLPSLRAAVSEHLQRSRGIVCAPEQVLVTGGTRSALHLLARLYLGGDNAAGVEDPGFPPAVSSLRASGAQVRACPVDQDGLLVDRLPAGLGLVHCTPSHQFPMGGRLPVVRRQAVLAWARERRALVVEDDYDSEFRYDVAPLPALASLDPGWVVYLGTASAVLGPGAGIGWLIAPPEVVDKLAALRPALGDQTAAVLQEAFGMMLTSGEYERQVRRLRRSLAGRRAALVTALEGLPLDLSIRGDSAGRHIMVELPDGLRARHVQEALEAEAVRVAVLDDYASGPPPLQALLLGYSRATPDELVAATTRVGDVLARLRPAGARSE